MTITIAGTINEIQGARMIKLTTASANREPRVYCPAKDLLTDQEKLDM
jgi:hypothetical protein